MLLTLATPLTSPDRLGSVGEGVVFAAGSLLVIVSLADLVLATLSGRGRFGVYSGPMCHGLWRLLRVASKLNPAEGHPILNAAGPLMLVVVLALGVAVPTLGFSLMILPGLDGAFVIGGGQPVPPPSRHIGTALYISGFSFTTLGAGPFVPQSNGFRTLIVVQAAIGFATFTLAITYLLSVLSALRRRNSFAREVHHFTGGTDDGLVLLEAVAGDPGLRREVLLELARGLHDVHESHLAYPVLHFFRHRESHFTMSAQAAVAADMVDLARAAAPEADAWHQSADAVAAYGAATALLNDLGPRFLPGMMDEQIGSSVDRVVRAIVAVDGRGNEVEAAVKRYTTDSRCWRRWVAAFRRDMLFSPPIVE
jgi:hypothetical protein